MLKLEEIVFQKNGLNTANGAQYVLFDVRYSKSSDNLVDSNHTVSPRSEIIFPK